MPTDVIIYHNPECGTSRNTLAMIQSAGIEPHVIEYLKTPPSRMMLLQLIERANKVVKALAEAEKYDLIIQEAVYVNPKHDITDKVLRSLNASNGK